MPHHCADDLVGEETQELPEDAQRLEQVISWFFSVRRADVSLARQAFNIAAFE